MQLKDTIGNHYQAVTNEDLEDFAFAVMRSQVHELVRAL
jgi:hypothetical protein